MDIKTALWAFKLDLTDRTGMSERQLTPVECLAVAIAESCVRQEAILAKMADDQVGLDGYGPATTSEAAVERARSHRFKKVSARRLRRGDTTR
jgi:hypothetical protein